MAKILCFGSACKDIFFPTSKGKILETPEDLTSQKKIAFEIGAKYKIEKRYESLGGCAANVSVGLSRLEIQAQAVANVGRDEMGKWIIAELQKNKVATETVLAEKIESDLSAIIVDEKSADRVIFSHKNFGSDLDIEAEKFKAAEWIFLGDISDEWEKQFKNLTQEAQKEKKKIAFNPREIHIQERADKVREIIGLSEIVFLNKDEAIEIIAKTEPGFSSSEINDELFLLKKILGQGTKTAVITDGKRGAWAASEEKIFFAKGLEVAAVDSTGAGDAFLSGFLAAYAKEKSMDKCLRWGIANSANAVQFFGATTGLLSEEEIILKAEQVKVEEV